MTNEINNCGVGTTSYMLEYAGNEPCFYISEKILKLFDNEFDYRETASREDLTNRAATLFIGMAGGSATAPSGGGGDSSANNNLGRDEDEKDLLWSRRW